MERLMTTEEVAELLRIDAVTVRRLIMRGELTAYRIAGEYRFTPTDLEKFFESQRVVLDIRSKNQFGDKFTDQARSVLSLASEEARLLAHHYLGTEHLLLGLLREEGEPGGQVLRNSGVTLEKAREPVKQLLAAEQTTSAPESEQHGKS
jgi:excisionase family DNA binding protein